MANMHGACAETDLHVAMVYVLLIEWKPVLTFAVSYKIWRTIVCICWSSLTAQFTIRSVSNLASFERLLKHTFIQYMAFSVGRPIYLCTLDIQLFC
jgi:hypothetical protein